MTVGFGIMFSVWEKQMAQKLLKRMPRKVVPTDAGYRKPGTAGSMLGVSLLDHLILGSDSRFTIINTTKDEPI